MLYKIFAIDRHKERESKIGREKGRERVRDKKLICMKNPERRRRRGGMVHDRVSFSYGYQP